MSTRCDNCGGTGKLISPEHARRLRKAKGLTMAQVANRMAITITYLGHLETGKRDWNHTLERIFRGALK